MKTTSILIQAAVLGVALTCGTALQANYIQIVRPIAMTGVYPVDYQTVAFRDTTEAKMLRDAYVILATGDHDYSGHRVNAMQQVRAAADQLGLDVSGDGVGGKPLVLSNDKLREAKSLIVQVLDSSEVKGEAPVANHLRFAIREINTALGIK
jgi:hypothetical protein